MVNSGSILDTVKKALGIPEDYNVYDPDILMHINTALMGLNQVGVGPSDGFYVADKTSRWSDFTEHTVLLAGIPTYVYVKVKIMFDPPKSSFGLDALTKTAEKLEWRLRSQMLELEAVPDEPKHEE